MIMDLPLTFHPVRQELPRPRLEDSSASLYALVAENIAQAGLSPGGRVAIAVGSRGIANISSLLAATVRALQDASLTPFIVPAMGTHGARTLAGQIETLASLGITEATMGVPVTGTKEPVMAGQTDSGMAVWVDGEALGADAILPINRVKPHTAFTGIVESGPSKLLSVGLGKAASAETIHQAGLAHGIVEATRFWLASGKVPFGLALVENGWGETAEIIPLSPADWITKESQALDRARGLMARLPWEALDLLVVERMGKDISGTGMDLNVIGLDRRFPGIGATPQIKKIVVLDLTPGSRGNANGVGYADGVTRLLADKVDWEQTRSNALVAGFPEGAACPPVADNEEAAIRLALASLPDEVRDPKRCRAVRVADTSHLVELGVTPALLKELPPRVQRI